MTDGTDARVASRPLELALVSVDELSSGTPAMSQAAPIFNEGTESDDSIGSCSFEVTLDDADAVSAFKTPFRP